MLMQGVFRGILALFVAGLIGHTVVAQSLGDGPRKEIRAEKINGEGFKLDGKLDDDIWARAQFVKGFLMKEPDQGEQPSDPMEVAVSYDEAAVYIGARLYSKNPSALRQHLDRRDSQGPAEQFIVMLDTYLDRRTAYVFGVNTAGVRFERFHGEDSEFSRDYSFNPVWEARTSFDEQSWTTEMRIPFSQLRFTDKEKQVWGVNFNRWIPADNEDVFWIYVPREETGYSSRFGNLVGIENVKPSRRLELLPYLASDGSFTSDYNAADPFNDGSAVTSRLGGDLKVGLGPNLTLESTFNPDFGQVEADPAEVNLSAFETFFSERRSFFTEGSQLFDSEGATYFYSRRIGASPHGSSDGDFVSRPRNSTILGAAKLTGRLSNGLSVGALVAVTDKEFSKGFDTTNNLDISTKIEPRNFFGVTRLQKEFGSNASTVGIILTGVERDFDENDPMASVLRKRAYSGGSDLNLRFENGKYIVEADVGFSHIEGSPEVIENAQRSSARYFQRPDADYVKLDPTRTSLSGYKLGFEAFKNGGEPWRWGAGFSAESPEFEINDAGILGSADDVDYWTWFGLVESTPGKIFRRYSIFTNWFAGSNFGNVNTYSGWNVNGSMTWKNFWNSWWGLARDNRGISDSRTRGGPDVGKESGWTVWWGTDNGFRSTFQYGVDGLAANDELGGYLYNFRIRLSTRVGNRLSLSANPFFQREEQPRQYVATLGDDPIEAVFTAGGANTFGQRYVFSRIARSTISMQMRANYFFTPDLSLELYAEPFISNGRFFDNGQTPFERSLDLTQTGTDGTMIIDNPSGDGTFQVLDQNGIPIADTDGNTSFGSENFTSLSFRSNLVMRWEFFPGSTAFLVWQRNLSGGLTDINAQPGRNARFGNMFDSFNGDGSDFFAFKIAYWIPVS